MRAEGPSRRSGPTCPSQAGRRPLGAAPDAVVVGILTYLIAQVAGVRTRTGFAYLDLAVSFVYSFALIGFWGHTLGMARLEAVRR